MIAMLESCITILAGYTISKLSYYGRLELAAWTTPARLPRTPAIMFDQPAIYPWIESSENMNMSAEDALSYMTPVLRVYGIEPGILIMKMSLFIALNWLISHHAVSCWKITNYLYTRTTPTLSMI